MDENINYIDNIVKNAVDDYQLATNDAGWDKIANDLDKKDKNLLTYKVVIVCVLLLSIPAIWAAYKYHRQSDLAQNDVDYKSVLHSERELTQLEKLSVEDKDIVTINSEKTDDYKLSEIEVNSNAITKELERKKMKDTFAFSDDGKSPNLTEILQQHIDDNETIKSIPMTSINKEGCVPFELDLSVGIENVYSCSWKINGNVVSEKNKLKYSFSNPGFYIVSMNAKVTASKLSVYRIDTIVVNPKPKGEIILSADTVLLPGKPLRCKLANLEAQKYEWSFGDGTILEHHAPTYAYKEVGRYNLSLYVVDKNGCENVFEYQKDVLAIKAGLIRFPNYFVPERSGSSGGYYSKSNFKQNNIFAPKVIDNVEDYHLMILNRNGQLIFETRNIMQGWDGYYRNKICTPGVYVWKVKGHYQNGASYYENGDVTLLE